MALARTCGCLLTRSVPESMRHAQMILMRALRRAPRCSGPRNAPNKLDIFSEQLTPTSGVTHGSRADCPRLVRADVLRTRPLPLRARRRPSVLRRGAHRRERARGDRHAQSRRARPSASLAGRPRRCAARPRPAFSAPYSATPARARTGSRRSTLAAVAELHPVAPFTKSLLARMASGWTMCGGAPGSRRTRGQQRTRAARAAIDASHFADPIDRQPTVAHRRPRVLRCLRRPARRRPALLPGVRRAPHGDQRRAPQSRSARRCERIA
jgi:hypothetical protein